MTAKITTGIATEMPTHQSKRGFTLTEIAIVLGIIGLILGAIWVAAAAVYNNMRISTANTQLLQITQAVRAMYATSQIVDSGADMDPGHTTAQSGNGLTYLRAGVFPSSALDTGTPSTASKASNPWNGTIYIRSATYNGVADNGFAIIFDGVPSQGCIQLLTSSTGQGRDPGMWQAGAGAADSIPNGTTIPTGGFLASLAEAQCSTNSNAVGFWFTLSASS